MRRYVMDHNIYRWAANILGDLHELRIEGHVLPDLGRPGPVPVPSPGGVHGKLIEKARLG
jgi:hypothetical protein